MKIKPGLVGICVLILLINSSSSAQEHVTVGAQDSIQQEILGQMVGAYLTERGFKVRHKTGLSSYSLRTSLVEGQVDLALEDPAIVWFFELLKPDVLPPQKIYEKVKERDRKKGLLWLAKTNLEKQYVLVMGKEKARKLGVETISDLAEYLKKESGKFKIAMSSEFFFRPDCYVTLKQVYELSFLRPNIQQVPSGVGFGLLKGDKVDVVVAFSTDPLIAKYELVKLEDNRGVLFNYPVGIVVSEKVVEKHSRLRELIEKLSEAVPPASKMAQLNLEVYDGAFPREVARRYLVQKELIRMRK